MRVGVITTPMYLSSLRGEVMRFIVSVNDIHRVISCVGATVDRNLKSVGSIKLETICAT